MLTVEISGPDIREYSRIVYRCSVAPITVCRLASDIHRLSQSRMGTARDAKGSA